MRKVFVSFVLLTVVALLATACLLQEPEEPSAPIEVIPLDGEEAASEGEAAGTEAESVAESVAESESEPAGAETAIEESMVQLYEIVQAESEARFELDEELGGQPKTVVGATNQVSGQIAFGYDDLSTAEVGAIRLNARTLATDNSRRDRAINNFILRTGDFEFITFVPGEPIGLPESVEVGETVEFKWLAT